MAFTPSKYKHPPLTHEIPETRVAPIRTPSKVIAFVEGAIVPAMAIKRKIQLKDTME